jgi:hypothetical protein
MRAEDTDLEFGMIFNTQNDMYRQKFTPQIETPIDNQVALDEQYLRAKLEKKKRLEVVLERFNKKYKGQVEELEGRIQEYDRKADPKLAPLNSNRRGKVINEQIVREKLIELEAKRKNDKLVNVNSQFSNEKLPELKNKNSVSLANFKEARKTTGLVRRTFAADGSLPKLVKNPAQEPASAPTLPETGDDEPDIYDRVLCPKGCGRRFVPEVLERHVDICQKVFTGKRQVFNSAKYRLAKNYKRL